MQATSKDLRSNLRARVQCGLGLKLAGSAEFLVGVDISGAQQIFDPAENGEVIVTEHRNVYRKRLQSITPRPATVNK